MRASSACIAIVTHFEQYRPTAYKPTPNDVWTIGYGHTRGVREGDTCTMTTAIMWLHDDLHVAEGAVNHHVKGVVISQNQFDAIVSAVFNIGPGGPNKDGFLELHDGGPSTFLRKLNAGDIAGAAAEFPRWNKQTGKVLNGLTTRRAVERELFEHGPAPDA